MEREERTFSMEGNDRLPMVLRSCHRLEMVGCAYKLASRERVISRSTLAGSITVANGTRAMVCAGDRLALA